MLDIPTAVRELRKSGGTGRMGRFWMTFDSHTHQAHKHGGWFHGEKGEACRRIPRVFATADVRNESAEAMRLGMYLAPDFMLCAASDIFE